MEDIYNMFNKEKEYRNRMSEQDLFFYILRLKPRNVKWFIFKR